MMKKIDVVLLIAVLFVFLFGFVLGLLIDGGMG